MHITVHEFPHKIHIQMLEKIRKRVKYIKTKVRMYTLQNANYLIN